MSDDVVREPRAGDVYESNDPAEHGKRVKVLRLIDQFGQPKRAEVENLETWKRTMIQTSRLGTRKLRDYHLVSVAKAAPSPGSTTTPSP